MADGTPPVPSPSIARRSDEYLTRWAALKTDRSSYIEHWREISKYTLPRTGRFLEAPAANNSTRGVRRNGNIFDSTATRAVRVLAAGLMSGVTSPSRPWLKLQTPDDALNKNEEMARWLAKVSDLILRITAKSNAYRAFHSMYEELGLYGSAANVVVEDYADIIRCYPMTAGQYAFAQSDRNEVDTLYREFGLTVKQLVQQFGRDRVSPNVRNLWDTGVNLDAVRAVLHVIEPRRDRRYGAQDGRNMPWASCYMETAWQGGSVLRESGFEKFPALCPRWTTTAEDTYGGSPGMDALGDIKQLQHQQLRKSQAIDYQTKPPIILPAHLKGQDFDMLPGGVTFSDIAAGSTGRNLMDVNLNLNFLLGDIQDCRGRVNSAFYTDLFLLLMNDGGQQMTAREVAERHEEKLLMLGPVLERLDSEMLAPYVDIVFERIVAAGLLVGDLAPPDFARGAPIIVQFVGLLAQAQRAAGVNDVDRFLGTIGAVAGYQPDVVDKVNGDRFVDSYGDMLGIDPSLIRSTAEVEQIRGARAQAQAQTQELENQQLATQALKNIGVAQNNAAQAGVQTGG